MVSSKRESPETIGIDENTKNPNLSTGGDLFTFYIKYFRVFLIVNFSFSLPIFFCVLHRGRGRSWGSSTRASGTERSFWCSSGVPRPARGSCGLIFRAISFLKPGVRDVGAPPGPSGGRGRSTVREVCGVWLVATGAFVAHPSLPQPAARRPSHRW